MDRAVWGEESGAAPCPRAHAGRGTRKRGNLFCLTGLTFSFILNLISLAIQQSISLRYLTVMCGFHWCLLSHAGIPSKVSCFLDCLCLMLLTSRFPAIWCQGVPQLIMPPCLPGIATGQKMHFLCSYSVLQGCFLTMHVQHLGWCPCSWSPRAELLSHFQPSCCLPLSPLQPFAPSYLSCAPGVEGTSVVQCSRAMAVELSPVLISIDTTHPCCLELLPKL